MLSVAWSLSQKPSGIRRKRYGVPRIVFVNKMDRVGANYARVLEMMKAQLGANPLPLQLPIGEGTDFAGVIDLVTQKAMRWDTADQGQTYSEMEIPSEFQDEVDQARETLFESVAVEDEMLLEKYLNGEEITHNELLATGPHSDFKRGISAGAMWEFFEKSGCPATT